MTEEKYFIQWERLIATLSLLQVPVWVEVHPDRAARIISFRTLRRHQDMLWTALVSLKLWRAKLTSPDDTSLVEYEVSLNRFAGWPRDKTIYNLNPDR